MKVLLLLEAQQDLQDAYDYYEAQRPGLGLDLLQEFRGSVDRIIEHPIAWRSLDEIHRCCQLHRFPYGVLYRLDKSGNVLIVACMHMNRKPGWWKKR